MLNTSPPTGPTEVAPTSTSRPASSERREQRAPAGGNEQLPAADGAPVIEREHDDLGSVTSSVGRTVTRVDLHALAR
jgi:hypothetical protein